MGFTGLRSRTNDSATARILRQKRVEDASSYRRNVDMRHNETGLSVKGGGALGRSKMPCSQSGMDPKLLRGKSSQLNFDIQASGKQIDSIKRSFKKLSDIRFGRSPPSNIYGACGDPCNDLFDGNTGFCPDWLALK